MRFPDPSRSGMITVRREPERSRPRAPQPPHFSLHRQHNELHSTTIWGAPSIPHRPLRHVNPAQWGITLGTNRITARIHETCLSLTHGRTPCISLPPALSALQLSWTPQASRSKSHISPEPRLRAISRVLRLCDRPTSPALRTTPHAIPHPHGRYSEIAQSRHEPGARPAPSSPRNRVGTGLGLPQLLAQGGVQGIRENPHHT